MALVDGKTTAPDANGIIQGADGQQHVTGTNKLAGDSGNDKLEGHGDFNQYYGGNGSDTFIISAKFGQHTGDAATDFGTLAAYVTDFQGAGTWSATNNDFIAFEGFGAGATLTKIGEGDSTSSGTVFYYSITGGTLGADHYNVAINSVNHVALKSGDYAFYG